MQLLAYVDGIGIIGHAKRDVTDAFSVIEWDSIKMGLTANEGKRITYILWKAYWIPDNGL